jgi:hypothetical protein
MPTKTPSDFRSSVYSPHETAMVGYNAAKRAAEHAQSGIELNVPDTGYTNSPSVSEYFAPLLPWEICAILAQTAMGKSLFTNWWIRQAARQLKEQKREEIIIHVSLEETIEAQAFQEYARILNVKTSDLARGKIVDWENMQWAMTQIDGIPIWRIGDSSERSESAPELYLTNIYRCIRELIKGNVTGDTFKPALVVIDYLQALPIDPEVKSATIDQRRRLQVRSDVYRLRAMTTHLGCPIIVCVQAKQHLEGNNPPMMIPGIYDGEESASISQRFDRIISLWMPKVTHVIGSTIQCENRAISVTDNNVFLKVNKQRGGLPTGRIWELKICYDTQEYLGIFGKTVFEKEEAARVAREPFDG